MSFDLEQHLKQICEAHTPTLDLYDRLIRVRADAEKIWESQRLAWFTDHRAKTHSRYIIEHLGDVLVHLQKTSQKLSPHELYILLASCYLHDIGMQDFQIGNGRGVESFTDEDYNHIRKTHPKRARELITERALWRGRDDFHIDLDDDDYLVPIAVVSQGHGSAFFQGTVRELQRFPYSPGNMPLRADLLTALLLMGDELDLHRRRAIFPKEFAMSVVSLLHHHMHHYVASVEIVDGHTPKQRHIRLKMIYPKDSDEYRGLMSRWIGAKLRKQCELTKPILETRTQGELNWDFPIEIVEYIEGDSGSQRPLPKPVIVELQHQVLEEQSVDRKELLKAFRKTIAQSLQQFQVVQIINQNGSDWGFLVKWLKVICECERVANVHLAFQQTIGHNPLDILARLASKLQEKGICNCPNYNGAKALIPEFQTDALEKYGQALVVDLKGRDDSLSLMIILEGADQAESGTMHWLETWLLPEFAKQNINLLVVMTKFNENVIKDFSKQWQTFSLLPFTKDQISLHLQEELGFSPESAEHESENMHTLSEGKPLNIYNSLDLKQRKSIAITSG